MSWPIPKLADANVVSDNAHVAFETNEEIEVLCAKVPSVKKQVGNKRWNQMVHSETAHAVVPPNSPSQAFDKLHAILDEFIFHNNVMRSLHLCEAPGGFAYATLCRYPNIERLFVTSVLRTDAPCFAAKLQEEKRVHILCPGDGDILSQDVRTKLVSCVSASVDFVTADGAAADGSQKHDELEESTIHLIQAEILLTLNLLREKGDAVIKIFTSRRGETLDVIALLSYLFDEVTLCKPRSSKSTNSERYLVCTSYKREFADNLGILGNLDKLPILHRHDAWSRSVLAIDAIFTEQQAKALKKCIREALSASSG